jgi:glycosyltransferase involved in cell wall biosynthesis
VAETPRVTVLMAVRDGARYLREAVASILAQTYRDFEFLVIDDGSADATAAIVGSFGDPRVRLVRNTEPLGLSASLNAGIDLARGEYIARMDGDDVSLPERLARQVAHLDARPACAVVGVKMRLIGPAGEDAGVWEADARTTTSDEIRRQLPRGNCVPHPGVMIRAAVLRSHRYRTRRSAQDYDLWLRLCAEGLLIEKLDTPLLLYRRHGESVSARQRTGRSGRKVELAIRWLYLRDRLLRARFSRFDCLVLKHAGLDQARHWKRRLGERFRALGGGRRDRGAAA